MLSAPAGKNGSDQVKRHPALIPLSHDHHHALVEARRLRRAADTPRSTAVATAFLRFFSDETVGHFREEEELLFPRVVGFEEARGLLVQALLEHQRLHALAARLQQVIATGGAAGGVMRELGELLEAHVRLEERRLFPLIERLLEDVTELQPPCGAIRVVMAIRFQALITVIAQTS